MSTSVIAVLVVPILMRWALVLANRPSPEKDRFLPSPPIRIIYPAGLVLFVWGLCWSVTSILDPHETGKGSLYLAAALSAFFTGTTVASWPIVVEVSEQGLKWHKLLWRHSLSWAEIEAIDSDMDGGLVIYGRGGQRIQVSQYTEGRPELKAIIRKHIHSDN